MYISIYVNKEEKSWLKEQPEGTVRELIQSAMGEELQEGTSFQEKPPVKSSPRKPITPKILETEKTVKAAGLLTRAPKLGDGLTTCKHCGYLLPYRKTSCKMCRRKQ